MNLQLVHGRPTDETGREMREIRVYDLLDGLEIDFWRVDHDAARTMEDCAEADALLGEDTAICKNLFLRNSKGSAYYLLMLPGDKKFVTKELSKQIGTTRLSFAGSDKLLEYLDILPGSVSVMGLMNDREHHVELLMDEDVLKLPYVGCHPCMSTTSMKIRKEDLLEKFLPAVGHVPRMVRL
ncbi:MAG: prolyl-tRNA synthetase associated domain-containing protein [Oscillospiraceae bacterium]|nr:prolyl-tRNA synthetase associated domain-containing protein [Oscillospiraceae bacterium]